MAVYVNDLLIASSCKGELQNTKESIAKEVEVVDKARRNPS